MITVDTHSFIPLPFKGESWALDAGARGFVFAKQLADIGVKVIALEPDKTVTPERDHVNINFFHEALYHKNCQAVYAEWSTGEGNMVFEPEEYTTENYAHMLRSPVECRTIEYYMQLFGIEMFELIKLDIEGAEFLIMEKYIKEKKILTKQFSIEWHYFTGRNEHVKFNKDILQDKWWTDNYECLKDDPMDSVYVLKNN